MLVLLRRIFVLFLVFGALWFFYGDNYKEAGFSGVVEEVRTDFQAVREHPAVASTVENIRKGIHYISDRIAGGMDLNEESPTAERPDLEDPSAHSFSVHNIELGDARVDVEAELGTPERVSLNEYGVNWNTYHENYQHFVMVAYDEDEQVNGLYTNQDLLTSTNGITFKSTRGEVLEVLPDPLDTIRKGFVRYEVQNNGEYHIFEIDQSYVTVFYDMHQDTKVTAVLILDEDMENQKKNYFANPSEELQMGLEYQLFDLTNAVRVNHGLSVLSWEEQARETVRAHSRDMANNDYFSHTNLEGQSPFDRLTEDAISYRTAGENLAAGQPSSIFAHEGLMNSLGHRENKLQSRYQYLVVGVSFNDGQPFYTENYISR